MSQTLGEKLRQAREELGISLSEVAEQTRISPLYLESIEKDNYKMLPGGIFNKGFVKAYARYIGFDEQEALQDYARILAESEGKEDDHLRTYRPEVLTDERAAPSMLPTIIFAAIILALMSGGVWFLVNYLRNQPEAPVANTAAPTNTPAATVNSAPPQNSALQPPAAGDTISIELKAVGEPVWTSYTVDGQQKIHTLIPDSPLKLDAKESFKITYSKAKLPNLQIALNGKPIKASNTADKSKIELEINKANVAVVFESGEISAGGATPTDARATPKPAATPSPPAATTPTAKPSPTPIVIRPRTVPTPQRSPN